MQPRRQEPQGAKIVSFKDVQARARRRMLPVVDPEEEKWRVRSNIAALLFAALLVAVGWVLVQKLGESARLQDCLMSGRTNCAPIIVPPADK